MWFWLEPPQLLHIQRRDALLIPYTCLFPKALLETYAFKCDSHGLPSCKACIMTIQEQYWCAVVSQTFSLFPSLWFRSSRPRTPEGRARYSLLLLVKLFLFVYLPVLVFVFFGACSFVLCAFAACLRALPFCCASIGSVKNSEQIYACVCVCEMEQGARPHGILVISIFFSFFASHISVTLPLLQCVITLVPPRFMSVT